MKTKYPKIIYVQKEEEDSEEGYLLAFEDAGEANDGEVAIYELKNTANIETKTEVVIDKKKING